MMSAGVARLLSYETELSKMLKRSHACTPHDVACQAPISSTSKRVGLAKHQVQPWEVEGPEPSPGMPGVVSVLWVKDVQVMGLRGSDTGPIMPAKTMYCSR